MRFYLLAITVTALVFPHVLEAQKAEKFVTGKVMELSASGNKLSLPGVSVYWQGTTIGTSTDSDGAFKLKRTKESLPLIASFVGFNSDTIRHLPSGSLSIVLKPNIQLQEVEVVHTKKSTEISYMNPIKLENIGEKELQKAACCDLSESFETSPSVDVSFTDAITGTKQIQLLGLAGPYTQITRENMPDVRGLSSIFGLEYIPGTWIEGIQLNKGTGSVVNGFESVAGQINVELRKPEDSDKLYLNGYLNQMGRQEWNLNTATKLNDKWSTGILLHGRNNSRVNDRNGDGFLDGTMNNHIIALNRWKYEGPTGLCVIAGVKGSRLTNLGGQVGYDPANDVATSGLWGMNMVTNRYEGWAKLGKVSQKKPAKSFGSQYFFATHDQRSNFGRRNYDAKQNSFYGNFIYSNTLWNCSHTVKTGLSFQYDDYVESLRTTTTNDVFDRREIVPGVFAEYTYTSGEVFSAVAGIRGDYHNIYGGFLTPRAHLRYALTETTVLRASAGRGQRTANIIADNIGILASSRQIITPPLANGKPYGLDAEVAWNFGFNITQEFRLDYRDGRIGLDLYRTEFMNQVVVNVDRSPQQVVFQNLSGKSYSNSIQLQLDYELIKRLDVRIAYRLFDVKTTFDGTLLQKPLISQDRAFINLGYETKSKWKFDYTLNWQGAKRLPNTSSNPTQYQVAEQSPNFVLMNAQISKAWNDAFEVYLGAENLTNFRQHHAILAHEAPFSPYFDSSMIWGPVFGRNIYLGFRYRIK